MSQAIEHKRWTWEEYLDWEQHQPRKHELVDGQVHAVVGSTSQHDVICNNLRSELRIQLRGKPCRVQGPDLKVRAGHNARYPDALIDCGPFVRNALLAQEPAAVFEVLSKSTAWIDQGLKLRDYDATPSIGLYALISQDEPRVLVYRRDDAGRLGARNAELLEGLTGSILVPNLDVTIPLARLYEALEFDQEPR